MARGKPVAPGFRKLSGRSERYLDLSTGQELSRRQYDKLYGLLKQRGFTSYERQAKANEEIEIQKHLSRPARNRPSLQTAQKQSGKSPQEIIENRMMGRDLSKLKKIIQGAENRKVRLPKSLSNRNFKPGKKGRHFRTRLDFDAMADFIETASNFKNAAVYSYGIEFYDTRKKHRGAVTLVPLRDFSVPFDDSDWDDILDWIADHDYVQLLFGMVYVGLNIETYEKLARKKT